jgi:hypothetical protein
MSREILVDSGAIFGTHPHAGMKGLASSYEEYHWNTFEVDIHHYIKDSKNLSK